MSVQEPPPRVRLRLLEKQGDAAAEMSKARAEHRVLFEPPTSEMRARRAAKRLERSMRLATSPAPGRDTPLVVPVETSAGKARRAVAEAFVRCIAAVSPPSGWRVTNGVELQQDEVAFALAHTDSSTMVFVLKARGESRRAFDTECFAVGYRNTLSREDTATRDALLAWARRAIRVAEGESAAASEGFPAALFARATTQLEYYPHDGRIELRPTLACDHFCDFCCSVDRGTTTNALRGLQELRATRGDWDHLPIRTVVISGGEPTLLRDLPELIRELADDGYLVELQTNGMSLDDPRYARTLEYAGLNGVLISLHSRDPRRSDEEITHHPGAWARTVRGIGNALDAGLTVSLSHVVSRVNQDETFEFVRFVDARWGDRVGIRIGVVSPTGDAASDPSSMIPELPTLAPGLRKALGYIERRRMNAWLIGYCGVPPCLLHPYEDFSDVNRRTGTAYSESRVKLDACRTCDYRDRCPGIWRAYHATYGDPGLRPVKRTRLTELQRTYRRSRLGRLVEDALALAGFRPR